MKNINLLPWRSDQRARKQKKIKLFFLVMLLLILSGGWLLRWCFYFTANKPAVVRPSRPLKVPFQLTGYLHQGIQSIALVVLSCGKLKDVRKGDVIERGWRAVNIDEYKIVIQKGENKVTLNFP